MSVQDKTYVCFDADTDIHCYQLMKAWKENEHIDFNFDNAHELNTIRSTSSEETIKRKLKERLQNTKILIVLIGKNIANLYKYVRWEIEYAIENNIPIIGVNLNGKRTQDDLCPPILKDKLAVYIPFSPKIVAYALNSWITSHNSYKAQGVSGPFEYNDSVYNNL